MDAQPNNKYMFTLSQIMAIPVVRQFIFLGGIAASVALGAYLYSSIKEPTYLPLNYQVSQDNISAITSALDKNDFNYKIDPTSGVLYVAADQVQKAKLKLESAGVSKDDSISFNYLNQQGSIGNSQFLENARYIRALENDLSKTISRMDGISNAKVHIAVPQGNAFADENQHPTASIVVYIGKGQLLDQEKVRAIADIVANSVPGLDEKFVSITDQSGHFLSGALSQDSIYSSQQLNYQNKLQAYFENRIQSMLVPLIGSNNVNVRVYANLDFTQNEEANEKFDPQTVIKSEQTVSESEAGGGSGGAPGSLSNTPGDSSAGAAAKGSGGSGGTGKSESVKNFEVSKTVTYKKSLVPKIINLSAAVVVDGEEVIDPKTKKKTQTKLSKDTIDKIDELVKATIGYDEKRGDKVTVVNSAFNNADDDIAGYKQSFWDNAWFWVIIKNLITISLGLGVLFYGIKRLFAYIKANNANTNITYSLNADDSSGISPEMQKLKQEQINRLKELAGRDPNRVSVIIKSWVEK